MVKTTDYVESRRWHLLWLVHTQGALTNAAQTVGFNYDYARSIMQAYNREGAEGVRNRRKDSRTQQPRSLLTAEQQRALEARLETPPDLTHYHWWPA
jgi:molybdenum-dependent DNA-binding transcriptional regulator ModE